jgi:hypothetical protein
LFSFSLYSLLIIACLVAYQLNKQSLPAYLRYLQYLLAIALIFEVSAEILSLYDINSYFLDHFYQPIELIFLSTLYYHAIDNKTFRKTIRAVVLLALIVSIVLSIWVEGIFNPNTASFIIGSTLIILYSILYKYQLFTSPPTKESLLINPFFWINTANLFFYCGTFFQMGLDSYIRKGNAALADQLHIIIYGLNYMLHILYLIGFLCKRIFKSYSSL